MITIESVRRVLVHENGWAEQDRGDEAVFRAAAGRGVGGGRVALPSAGVLGEDDVQRLLREMTACGLAEDEDEARDMFAAGSPS